MHRTCIAIVDASRARLFTLERSAETIGLREVLTEQRDLVNPARRLRTAELMSSTRPGIARAGDLQFGLDDHRAQYVARLDAVFSRMIVAELAELMRAVHADRVILCASPRMLGELRSAGANRLDARVIDEVPRDLAKLTPAKLRDQLASYGLLPAVQRAATR